jgi:LPXTG-motif cell wall-anchored protein
MRPEEKIVPTPEPKPDTPSTGHDTGKWNGTFGFSLIALILAALLRKRYGDEA